jgi:hypothetical protein
MRPKNRGHGGSYVAKIAGMDEPIPAVPERVARFREEYRASEIPRGYSPYAHLVFTFVGGSVALIACLWQLHDVRALEWLTVPLAFLYANFAEYFGHRFPMHHPMPPLKAVFKRHAGQHHCYFNADSMPLTDALDLRAVLFPPVLVIFFFGVFATPVWFLLRALVSANVAWLFIATGVAYFLNYELLHLLHHAPKHWRIAQTALLKRWSALHRTHHDPALMTHWNFNITYPIGDLLFGTWKADAEAKRSADDADKSGRGRTATELAE